jgi:hypothetical protein
MIIDNNYTLEELEKLFLPHREGIDPGSYRVGKINDKLFVWNPDNNYLMEYYFDDQPDKELFDVSEYFKFKDGKIIEKAYYIRRDGTLYSKQSKRNLIIHKETYPCYGLNYIGTGKGHSKRAMIHLILAKIFIPNFNPEDNIIVDHIDHNKYNYLLNNLRWVTISDNAKNSKPRSTNRFKERIYEAYEDRNHTKLKYTITESEALERGYKPIFLNDVSEPGRVNKNKKFIFAYGSYWMSMSKLVFDYFASFGYTSVKSIFEDPLWKPCYIPGILCHPLGVIKWTGNYNNKFSIGNSRTNDSPNNKYNTVSIQGKSYSIHRIIATTFLNNGNPIEDGLEVDHISTDTTDNRVSNLRIVTHKENMNNTKTQKTLSNGVVIDPEGREFMSVSECSRYYNVSRGLIYLRIKDPNTNFKFKED